MNEEENIEARELILDVLANPIVENLNFTMGRWSIRSSMYQEVSDAIVEGKISVVVSNSFLNATAQARYVHKAKSDTSTIYDVICLRRAMLGRTRTVRVKMAGVIVHECTHAGTDLLALGGMTHLENEMLSYIVHYSVIWAELAQLNARPAESTHTSAQARSAWKIATSVQQSTHLQMVDTGTLDQYSNRPAVFTQHVHRFGK
ncbi:MAG: hypothetical protein QNK92_10155 [Amylibacter sp.]